MMEKVVILLVTVIGLTLSSASPSIQGKGNTYTTIPVLTKRIFENFVDFNVKQAADKKVMVCYWGAWSAYRNGQCKFDVDNIDPKYLKLKSL